MTVAEIIKALECCNNDEAVLCNKCPLKNECDNNPLDDVKARYALDLINRQQAENKRLKKGWKADVIETQNIKAEAIKEFAERLKDDMVPNIDDSYIESFVEEYIDNLVKEMVGEE